MKIQCYECFMPRAAGPTLGVLAMVVLIVAADVLIFRHHFWPRLMANAGIVLVFAAFYVRFRHRL